MAELYLAWLIWKGPGYYDLDTHSEAKERKKYYSPKTFLTSSSKSLYKKVEEIKKKLTEHEEIGYIIKGVENYYRKHKSEDPKWLNLQTNRWNKSNSNPLSWFFR